MIIYGKWHARGSAAQFSATLKIADKSFTIEVENGITYSGEQQRLEVGSRLGNVERKIILEDESIFATKDNDAIDIVFDKELKSKKLIHTLESKIVWVFIAIAVSILFTFSFFKWGVPSLSKKIAYSLPEKTNQLLALNTLDFLDKYMFKKSEISERKKEKIREHFHSRIVPLSKEHEEIRYKLHFRLYTDNNMSIPNAMALPSGDIILTDKFVQLCQSQEEMDSVLLHEMGHIVHRHTLQMVIESTFISVAVMTMLGDSNGLADMGVGLGTLLVSSSYSRKHESQADNYAFEQMLVAKIDPIVFFNIMNRMSEYMQISVNSSEDTSSLEYLSSHPKTQERVEIAKEYSECFKRGQITCDRVKK